LAPVLLLGSGIFVNRNQPDFFAGNLNQPDFFAGDRNQPDFLVVDRNQPDFLPVTGINRIFCR
jgi:hypothetical protein